MKEAPKKKVNAFYRFSSAGIQMGILIAAGAWGGQSLDEKQGNETPVYTIILSLLGVGAGLYLIIKEVVNLSKEEEDKTS